MRPRTVSFVPPWKGTMPSAKSLKPKPMYKITVTPRLQASRTASTMGDALKTGDCMKTSSFANFRATSLVKLTWVSVTYLAARLRFADYANRGGREWPEAVCLPRPWERDHVENGNRMV